MWSDHLSPYKLIVLHHCSSRFCLPSSVHFLKNENKLSMEISCQIFWNKQYKLLNKYVWETHTVVELEACQQGPKWLYHFRQCQDHQDRRWEAYPHENHTPWKGLPNSGNQNWMSSQNCIVLQQNHNHDGSLVELSLSPCFHDLQNPSSPRHSFLHGMG